MEVGQTTCTGFHTGFFAGGGKPFLEIVNCVCEIDSV